MLNIITIFSRVEKHEARHEEQHIIQNILYMYLYYIISSVTAYKHWGRQSVNRIELLLYAATY